MTSSLQLWQLMLVGCSFSSWFLRMESSTLTSKEDKHSHKNSVQLLRFVCHRQSVLYYVGCFAR